MQQMEDYLSASCGECGEISCGFFGTNVLNYLIRKAGSVIGCKPDTSEAVEKVTNPDHPLQHLQTGSLQQADSALLPKGELNRSYHMFTPCNTIYLYGKETSAR